MAVKACKIFVDQGKLRKDRYILFPESFRLALKAYLAANPENEYLFESRHRQCPAVFSGRKDSCDSDAAAPRL